MPAAVAVPLITAGVSAGTSLIGAKMASNAATRAGQTQRTAAEAAATDSRRASADALAYIERSRQMPGSSASYTYLSRLLGVPGAGAARPGTSTGAAPLEMPTLQAPVDGTMRPMSAAAQLFGGASTAKGGMVLLQAPDGRRKAVPAQQADHYLAMGAVRVS